ncbi:MAG: hypothetical protein AAGB03_11490 [Pseudomonadota bacterium]
MLRLFSAVFVSLAVLAAPTAAQELDDSGRPLPQNLVLGLDMSASNPLVDNPNFASKVADRVRPLIEDLPIRSEVRLRTFGSYNSSANHLRLDRKLSIKQRPEDVAELIGTIIAGIPTLVKDGKLKTHQRTNILAFLETMEKVTDCSAMPTTVILVTDGVEESTYADLRIRSTRGKTPPQEEGETWAHFLPKPGRDFRSCRELQMLGLGFGQDNPAYTAFLQDEWGAWAKKAGFKQYTGLYDW